MKAELISSLVLIILVGLVYLLRRPGVRDLVKGLMIVASRAANAEVELAKRAKQGKDVVPLAEFDPICGYTSAAAIKERNAEQYHYPTIKVGDVIMPYIEGAPLLPKGWTIEVNHRADHEDCMGQPNPHWAGTATRRVGDKPAVVCGTGATENEARTNTVMNVYRYVSEEWAKREATEQAVMEVIRNNRYDQTFGILEAFGVGDPNWVSNVDKMFGRITERDWVQASRLNRERAVPEGWEVSVYSNSRLTFCGIPIPHWSGEARRIHDGARGAVVRGNAVNEDEALRLTIKNIHAFEYKEKLNA